MDGEDLRRLTRTTLRLARCTTALSVPTLLYSSPISIDMQGFILGKNLTHVLIVVIRRQVKTIWWRDMCSPTLVKNHLHAHIALIEQGKKFTFLHIWKVTAIAVGRTYKARLIFFYAGFASMVKETSSMHYCTSRIHFQGVEVFVLYFFKFKNLYTCIGEEKIWGSFYFKYQKLFD